MSNLRDREKPLTLPKVHRNTSQYCAVCGRPVGASHEAFAKFRYCSIKCHKEGRRINQAENRKRKVLRAVTPPVPGVAAVPDPPKGHRCIACERAAPDVKFTRDNSRVVPFAIRCVDCDSAKNKAYYEAHKDRLAPENKERKRVYRTQTPVEVPRGVGLSAKQLKSCCDNLRQIKAALPLPAITALIQSLREGRVNGMVFEDRQGCGCLWGTAGRACGWSVSEEGRWAKTFRKRWCAEIHLFGRIAPGDTPDLNPYVAICVAILEE